MADTFKYDRQIQWTYCWIDRQTEKNDGKVISMTLCQSVVQVMTEHNYTYICMYQGQGQFISSANSVVLEYKATKQILTQWEFDIFY